MQTVIMLFIKKKCKKQNRDWKLVFLFLFFHFIFLSQNSTDTVGLRLKEKVIDYYTKLNSLCYKFKERRYVITTTKPLISHARMLLYKEGTEIYYRGTHIVDTFQIKHESIKNGKYFGTNNYLKGQSYFNDYKNLPEKKRYFGFNNTPDKILKPDTSLRTTFFNPAFNSNVTLDEKNYILLLTDTNVTPFGPDGHRTKTLKTYHISRQDYSIQRYSAQYFWTTGDLNQSDSVIYTFTYFKEPLDKIKKYVNSFEPLTGEKLVMPKQPKDTLKIFPEFHLPDSTGKVKAPISQYALIDFWYKACAPCLANMKHLDKIKNKNIEIITVNIKDSVDKDVRKIMSKHNFTFLFEGQGLAKQLNINSYPTMYIIDKNRNVLLKKVGYGPSEEFDELIEKLSVKD
jgi:thiol-disulfide isomerase/thioredoxin